MNVRHRGRLTASLLALTLALAACSGAGGSLAPSEPPASPPPEAPITSPPDAGSFPPLADGAKVVVPRPGQLDVRPVNAETLAAKVDGRSVTVAVDWWSGVEPCTILDSIVVEKHASGFAITLREGRGPEEVACVAMAELHRAFIELGALEPGTYTITDGTGAAAAIEIVVS